MSVDTVGKITNQYLLKKQRAYSIGVIRQSTLDKISQIIDLKILPNFGSIKLKKFKGDHWEDYLATHPKRVHETRVYMVSVLDLAVKEGVLKKSPELMKPPESDFEGRALTVKEVKMLLASTEPGELDLFVKLGLCGMRSGEIRELEWNRVDLKRGVIHLREIDTKTKKARSFPVSLKLKKLLESRKCQRKNVGKVFTKSSSWFTNSFNKLIKTSGINGRVTPHSLRHTFLTHAAKQIKNKTNEFSAVEVCVYAGLSMKVFMSRYLHLKPEDLQGLTGVIGQ